MTRGKKRLGFRISLWAVQQALPHWPRITAGRNHTKHVYILKQTTVKNGG